MTTSTATTPTFTVPSRDQLTVEGQAMYVGVKAGFGKVPNLYAYMAQSANGLGAYLAFQQSQAKGSFNAREREAIFLVVSEVNGCKYCQSAHTYLGKGVGFTDTEILELRAGRSTDARLDAIVKFAADVTTSHGRASTDTVENFFAEGFTEAAMIDLVMLVTDKIASNYIHNLTGVEIDWPIAPTLV